MTSVWLPLGIDGVGVLRNVWGGLVPVSSGVVNTQIINVTQQINGGGTADVINVTNVTYTGTLTGPSAVFDDLFVTTVRDKAGTGPPGFPLGLTSTGDIVSTASVFDHSNRVLTAITAGTGISVSGSAPTLTVANTGVLSVTAGTNVTITGTAAAPIISSTTTNVFDTIQADSIVNKAGNGPPSFGGGLTANGALVANAASTTNGVLSTNAARTRNLNNAMGNAGGPEVVDLASGTPIVHYGTPATSRAGVMRFNFTTLDFVAGSGTAVISRDVGNDSGGTPVGNLNTTIVKCGVLRGSTQNHDGAGFQGPNALICGFILAPGNFGLTTTNGVVLMIKNVGLVTTDAPCYVDVWWELWEYNT